MKRADVVPLVGAACLGGMFAACAPELGQRSEELLAYCSVDVTEVGLVEVETDYLPRVISCENGAAGFEALKAQAVAARSYLYYRLDTTGEISDGTGDQVYSCGREPEPQHYRAVEETAGQVLQYRGVQVAAFYVAGALQMGPSCRGGGMDPTATEAFVTYNEGNMGDEVEQTALGFISPSNDANRGCKSQNGAACLAEQGWLYDRILRFYYGEDIDLVLAEGPCAGASLPPDAGIAEDDVSSSCRVAQPQAMGLVLLVGLWAMRRRRGA